MVTTFLFFLPNTVLKDSVKNLASIFQQGIDKIVQVKLTLLNVNTSSPRMDKADKYVTIDTKHHLLLQG